LQIGAFLFTFKLMIQKNITVAKTARYFQLGEVSNKIEEIWLVCHGYGQLANYFLKKFEILDDGKTLLVAPEALHRFYWKDFSGRVGASWMTKEDRKEEIFDYVNYLDTVFTEILSEFEGREIKINVLGFSQATATVCRWLAATKTKVDHLILWGGFFPHDLDFEQDKDYFNSIKPHLLIGTNDEFYNLESIDKHRKMLEDNGFICAFTHFEGKHDIPQEILIQLTEKLKLKAV
jgi:predicted esterase